MIENPEKTFKDLTAILKFVTENKYVIEAIFENVLLESQLLNHPFTSFNDSEKKVLMETLLLNEEFKEYIYQKIAKEELKKMEGMAEEMEMAISSTDPHLETATALKDTQKIAEEEMPTGQIDDDTDLHQENVMRFNPNSMESGTKYEYDSKLDEDTNMIGRTSTEEAEKKRMIHTTKI